MIGMVKQKASDALRFQYWPIVGIGLLAGVLSGGTVSFSYNQAGMDNLREAFGNDELFRRIMGLLIGIAITVSVVSLLYLFLVGNVIRVGNAKILLSAYRHERFRITDLFAGFRQYGRLVGTMALYTLFVTLGFMCFIVPGIIVALGLFEVPYLLSEDPSLSGMDVIRRSWEDMRGHKGELFGLVMSFFGWIILTILTFGVLAIFYTGPYISLSEAGYYHELHHSVTAENFTADGFHA